jgi:Ca2+-binding EF-hand superfamily protein
MKLRALIAFAATAALASPLALKAAGDKATSPGGDAEAAFESLDKDKDGFLSRAEATGTPYDKDFVRLDKNMDGKLSRQEHAAAPQPSSGKAATGGSSKKY